MSENYPFELLTAIKNSGGIDKYAKTYTDTTNLGPEYDALFQRYREAQCVLADLRSEINQKIESDLQTADRFPEEGDEIVLKSGAEAFVMGSGLFTIEEDSEVVVRQALRHDLWGSGPVVLSVPRMTVFDPVYKLTYEVDLDQPWEFVE